MNKLEQLFLDNQNVPRRYEINAKAEASEIFLYDAIGGFGISAERFVKDLKAIKSPVIHLRVNSPGGEVDAARAISTAISQHPSKIIAHVDGLAASSASFLILAADEIEISDGAFIMVHAPWAMTLGNAADHAAAVELLAKYGDAIANDYVKRTGKTLEEVRAWMASETWFSAQESVDAGLADRIVKTTATKNEWNLSAYRNAPAALLRPHQSTNPGVSMSTNTIAPAAATERARVSEINRIGTLATMPADAIQNAIEKGQTVEAFKDAVLEAMFQRDMKNDTRVGAACATITRDALDSLRAGISDGILSRATGKPPTDAGRPYCSMSLMDMSRTYLRHMGVSDSAMGSDPMRIAGNAMGLTTVYGQHSTSDFPAILGDTVRRYLMSMYDAAPAVLKTISRKRSTPDFRTIRPVRLGEFPTLLEVPEGGEITKGTINEAKESYTIASFARIFSITRQALVNDDLSAFTTLPRSAAQAAIELEARTLTNLLALNSGAGPTLSDTYALFHANHNNLAASGAAIGDSTLSAARLALRSQKGLDATTLIDLTPAYLVVPAALETTAQKYLATIQPATAATANPFAGALQLLVEPRLDAVSAFRWYVAAAPDMAPVLEYAHLAGAEGPQVETRLGWEVDGLEIKVRLDFGAGCVDWRGMYCNDGQ